MPNPELSQKQIEANRANALKSTGPRSNQGKHHSSKNAIKHGFFARDLLIPGEDPQELSELKVGMLKRLNPRDALELTLVDQIVADLWKLRRVRKAERDLFIKADEASRASGQTNPTDPGVLLARMLCTDDSEQNLDRLHRYERRLESSVFRGLREMRRLRMEESIDEPCDFVKQTIGQHEQENIPPADGAETCENEASPGSESASERDPNARFDQNEPVVKADNSQPRWNRSSDGSVEPVSALASLAETPK